LPRHFVPRNDELEFLLPWWEKVRMRVKAQDSTCHGMSLR